MSRRERVIIAETMKKFLRDRKNLVCLLKETADTKRNICDIVVVDIVEESMEYIGSFDRNETMEQAKGMSLPMLLCCLEDGIDAVWEHNNYYGGM